MKKLLLVLILLLASCTTTIETTESMEEVEVSDPLPMTSDVEEEVLEAVEEPVESTPPEVEPIELPIEEEVEEPVVEEPEPMIINGKTLEERLDDAYENLHEEGSSADLLVDFPDLELVFEDDPDDVKGFFPDEILPFHYYYSEEADKTFNLCGVGRSVFICDGMLDRPLRQEDIDSGRCEVTPEYLEDPRLN